eukprot:TRINITY_DN6138_c0_g1_i1.p1 TRINITY_DN6138_c0_g1~~TRINITY_DN6138_c0_g1_i1.p1  ORF type:complete len:351 (-),score=84.11 TRINITY_DN6138_c0_g1_i1:225-1277(-)
MDHHVIFDTPKRPSFTQHANKAPIPQVPALVWVNKNGGHYFSDKEIDTAYVFYHGSKFGKLTDTEIKRRFKGFPNPLTSSQIRKLRLRSDHIDVESIRNIIKNNRIQFNQFDPIREAFSFFDVERTGKISRERIKTVLEKQTGVGEITEEDIDDIFRICGADPSSQSDLTVENYRSIVDINHVEGLMDATKKRFNSVPDFELPRSASAQNLTTSRIFDYNSDSSDEFSEDEDQNDHSQTKISRSASVPVKLDHDLFPHLEINTNLPATASNAHVPVVTIHTPHSNTSSPPKTPFPKTLSNIKLPHISSTAMNKQELNPHYIATRTPSQMAPSRLMVSDPLATSPSKRFSM